MLDQCVIYQFKCQFVFFPQLCNFIGSLGNSGLKGPQKVSSSASQRWDEVALSFILFGLVNLQGWRLHNISGQLVPLPYCAYGENVFPLCLNLYFNLYSLSLAFLHRNWRVWLCLLNDLPVGPGRLLLGPTKAISSPGWTNPVPAASLHCTSAQVPTMSWWYSTELTAVYPCLCCTVWKAQDWTGYCRCGLVNAEWRKNITSSTGYLPGILLAFFVLPTDPFSDCS